MLRLRERLFNHKHGVKSTEVNWAVDRASRTLATCPLLSQKAINFATHGADVVMCGFHVSRYFHEATELNPAKNGALPIPEEEIQALCASPEVSYANASPPDPYMLEPVMKQGTLSGQKAKGMENIIVIDTKNPKFPDIPEELDESTDTTTEEEEEAEEDEKAPEAEARK
ncbi:hypothetical protein STCU_10666 [Strigomonas culicis]|nr:hypothetical protein STCU_10666 [Strigomonas culicis]|eukprot:EPY17361.1 hypothetical protein STCU_10666 [Strigomonas culicis]